MIIIIFQTPLYEGKNYYPNGDIEKVCEQAVHNRITNYQDA